MLAHYRARILQDLCAKYPQLKHRAIDTVLDMPSTATKTEIVAPRHAMIIPDLFAQVVDATAQAVAHVNAHTLFDRTVTERDALSYRVGFFIAPNV